MMEQRIYGPVPWNIRYSLSDWLSKQSKIARYKLHIPEDNSPEYVYVTFIEKATSQDKARIGRTLAWDGLRRQKQLEK